MVWLLVAFALAIAVLSLAHDARSAQASLPAPAKILSGFYSGGAPLPGSAETASVD